MHATWEVKENGVGGIATVVEDLVKKLNKGNDVKPIIIMPWFSFMKSPYEKALFIKEIEHFYKNELVYSSIYHLFLDNIHYFLIRPLGKYKNLLEIEDKNQIYSYSSNGYSLIDRMVYISSGISAFVFNLKINNRPVDFFHNHDISLSLINSIKKFHYKDRQKPKTIFHMHSFGKKQGVYLDYDHFGGTVNLTKEALNNSDHVITVSQGMIDDALNQNNVVNFGLRDEFEKLSTEGRVTAILNGINSYDWEKANSPTNILEEKKNSKKILKEKNIIKDVKKPIYTFIGRISEIKGISLFSYAYEEIKKSNGYFIIIGRNTGDIQSMDFIHSLKINNNNIITIIDQEWKNYFSSYKDFDFFIRKATDFNLFPSWLETCGLVPMEMMRFGAIPITSKAMGMRDYLVDLSSSAEGFLNVGNSFNFENGLSLEKKSDFAGENLKKAIAEANNFYKYSDAVKEKILERIFKESKKFDWDSPNGSLSKLINIYNKLN